MNWNIKIILHPAFKGDILWHFVWPPCWKGKITFWSRDHLRTYSFLENGAGLKITGHFILFKIRPTDRFSKAKSYNLHFHKNDVTWPLSAIGLFYWNTQRELLRRRERTGCEESVTVKNRSISRTALIYKFMQNLFCEKKLTDSAD